MKFIHRFAYFLIGLSVGSIFVYFIWEKKNVVFNYLPNARLLSDISRKDILYSPKFKENLDSKKIDTLTVNEILKSGNVDFWNKIKLDSCIQYDIEGIKNLNHITLTIINCKATTTINKVSFSEQ